MRKNDIIQAGGLGLCLVIDDVIGTLVKINFDLAVGIAIHIDVSVNIK
jgi:hypothetical protein